MVRGFTDESGRFRPTDSGNGTSSREKSIKTSGTKMRVLNISEPLSESSSQRKIEALIEKMSTDDPVLEEREINFIKNTLNRTPRDEWKMGEQDLLDTSWSKTDLEDGYEITSDQNEKGREWLNRKKQRDHMGFRETAIMDDFKEIRLQGFTETNSGSGYYIPYWKVIANDGATFTYRMSGGEISIDG